MRIAMMSAVLVMSVAGCSATFNPTAPTMTPAFETKLLNLQSLAEQLNGQTNYSPNNQTNLAQQTAAAVGNNGYVFAAIASPLSGAAAANANATTQAQTNIVTQVQAPIQTVL